MKQAASSPLCRETPQLYDLLVKTSGIISGLGPQFLHYTQKLNDLASRYSEGRYHLAVLGQFKRGKSALLNALTGEPILPVGVVPLTAAPTGSGCGREHQGRHPPGALVAAMRIEARRVADRAQATAMDGGGGH